MTESSAAILSDAKHNGVPEPGPLGMWVFLASEVMFFGGLFAAYAFYRSTSLEAFGLASRQLDVRLGALNTVVLLTSSLTMVYAVEAAKQGNRRNIVAHLGLTTALAVVFLGIKAYEYAHKFHQHRVPGHGFLASEGGGRGEELFFSFYFIMTGAHALHVLAGIGVLLTFAVLTARAPEGPMRHAPLESAGLYWHFVDIVWIFLFPSLYLLGRHA